MTYSPGSSGYPAQPPGSYGAPAPSFGPAAEPGPSKLPLYLTAAVAVLGLVTYLLSFGPMFKLSSDIGPFAGELTAGGSSFSVVASLLAGLLAAVSLLPKASNYAAVVAAVSAVGALLVVAELISKPEGFSVGWALWFILASTIIQTIVAVAALLLDAGVITPPAPRPKYEQPQYGQYGPPGGYYGQQSQPAPGPSQRPGGYPPQYGGYQPGPSAGGYGPGPQGAPQGGSHQGPPTPPTGYPSFSPPPAVGSGSGSGSGSSYGSGSGSGSSYGSHGPGPSPSSVSPSAPTQQAQQPSSNQPPSSGSSSS